MASRSPDNKPKAASESTKRKGARRGACYVRLLYKQPVAEMRQIRDCTGRILMVLEDEWRSEAMRVITELWLGN